MNTDTTAELHSRFERCRKFLEQDAGNPHLLAEASDLSLALGEFAFARTYAEKGLSLRPGDPFFSHRLAAVAIADKRWADAISIGQTLLAAGHNAPAVRYNVGFAALHVGDYMLARETLAPILGAPDAPPDTLRWYVRALHYLGQLDGDEGAIALAERHLETHPDDAIMSGMLGLLWLDAGDFEKARRWSQQALALQPADHDALLTSGTLALADEDEGAARKTFETAIEANAKSGRAWTGLGLADMLKLDVVAAQRQFENAVKYMPEHIGTWHALAWCQLLRGDLPGAQASFERSLMIDRNFAETHGGLASVAILQGRDEEARREAEIALRLDPQSFGARFVQLVELQKAGKGEAAQKLLERVLRGHSVPGGGTLSDMLSRVTARQMIARQTQPKKPDAKQN